MPFLFYLILRIFIKNNLINIKMSEKDRNGAPRPDKMPGFCDPYLWHRRSQWCWCHLKATKELFEHGCVTYYACLLLAGAVRSLYALTV